MSRGGKEAISFEPAKALVKGATATRDHRPSEFVWEAYQSYGLTEEFGRIPHWPNVPHLGECMALREWARPLIDWLHSCKGGEDEWLLARLYVLASAHTPTGGT